MTIFTPLIRVFYDYAKSAETIVVRFTKPQGELIDKEDHNGLMRYSIDKKTQTIHSLSINCKAIGGQKGEAELIKLLATIDMAQDKGQAINLPNKLTNVINDCREVIGADRIKLMQQFMQDEITSKWGSLYDLVEKLEYNVSRPAYESDHYGNRLKVAKDVVDYINLQRDPYKYYDEIINIMYNAYTVKSVKNGFGVYFASNAHHLLMSIWEQSGNAFLPKYITHVATEMQYNAAIWRVFIGAINSMMSSTMRWIFIRDTLYPILKNDFKDDRKNDNAAFARTLIIENLMVNDVYEEGNKYSDDIVQFWKTELLTETNEICKSKLSSSINDFEDEDEEDEGVAGNDGGNPINDEIDPINDEIDPFEIEHVAPPAFNAKKAYRKVKKVQGVNQEPLVDGWVPYVSKSYSINKAVTGIPFKKLEGKDHHLIANPKAVLNELELNIESSEIKAKKAAPIEYKIAKEAIQQMINKAQDEEDN